MKYIAIVLALLGTSAISLRQENASALASPQDVLAVQLALDEPCEPALDVSEK